MLVQRLEQYQKETKQRKRLDETKRKVEVLRKQLRERKDKMPMGKGTYGTTKGRPPKKKMTAKQKTLPAALQKKIMASKKKK